MKVKMTHTGFKEAIDGFLAVPKVEGDTNSLLADGESIKQEIRSTYEARGHVFRGLLTDPQSTFASINKRNRVDRTVLTVGVLEDDAITAKYKFTNAGSRGGQAYAPIPAHLAAYWLEFGVMRHLIDRGVRLRGADYVGGDYKARGGEGTVHSGYAPDPIITQIFTRHQKDLEGELVAVFESKFKKAFGDESVTR